MNNSPLVFISEFITVDHGKYIVKVSASENHVILGTALASGETVEQAEDKARQRAIEAIKWASNITLPPMLSQVETPTSPKRESSSKKAMTKTFQAQPGTTKEGNKIPAPIQPPVIPLSSSQPQPLSPQSNNFNESATVTANQEPVSTPTTSIQDEPPQITSSPTQPTPEPSEQPPIPPIENETPQVQLDFPVTPEDTHTIASSANEDAIKSPVTEPPTTMDFSQIINQTSIELKRLGWTQEDGKKYLLATYGKKSRHLLSDEELIEFLQYLQQQP